jgi:hypothetical protein
MVHLSDELSPIMITLAARAWLCVIMPMRPQGAAVVVERPQKDAEKTAPAPAPAKADPPKAEEPAAKPAANGFQKTTKFGAK